MKDKKITYKRYKKEEIYDYEESLMFDDSSIWIKAKERKMSISEDYIIKALETESNNFEVIKKRLDDNRFIRLYHAVSGMVTESGESLDMAKKHLFYGKKLDLVNIIEELGDACWYMCIAIDVLREYGVNVSWESIWGKNIKKLKGVRYKKGFSEKDAIERDLEKEREILEGQNQSTEIERLKDKICDLENEIAEYKEEDCLDAREN